MKKLENKKCTLVGKETTYAEILLLCNEVVPEKGWTPSTMAQAIKLDTVLKAANGTIEIEDADFILAKQVVENMKWAIKDVALVEFCDYIKSIK